MMLTLALTLALAATDSTRVNDFLAYDSATKVVYLTLAAARDGDNGGMSFNGAHDGGGVITVPRGWSVAATFVNEDNAVPHSAIVLARAPNANGAMSASAFAGAHTRDVAAGVEAGEHEPFRFAASTAGDYLIYCGVAGHAPAGMWIRLTVSPTASRPAYR